MNIPMLFSTEGAGQKMYMFVRFFMIGVMFCSEGESAYASVTLTYNIVI